MEEVNPNSHGTGLIIVDGNSLIFNDNSINNASNNVLNGAFSVINSPSKGVNDSVSLNVVEADFCKGADNECLIVENGLSLDGNNVVRLNFEDLNKLGFQLSLNPSDVTTYDINKGVNNFSDKILITTDAEQKDKLILSCPTDQSGLLNAQLPLSVASINNVVSEEALGNLPFQQLELISPFESNGVTYTLQLDDGNIISENPNVCEISVPRLSEDCDTVILNELVGTKRDLSAETVVPVCDSINQIKVNGRTPKNEVKQKTAPKPKNIYSNGIIINNSAESTKNMLIKRPSPIKGQSLLVRNHKKIAPVSMSIPDINTVNSKSKRVCLLSNNSPNRVNVSDKSVNFPSQAKSPGILTKAVAFDRNMMNAKKLKTGIATSKLDSSSLHYSASPIVNSNKISSSLHSEQKATSDRETKKNILGRPNTEVRKQPILKKPVKMQPVRIGTVNGNFSEVECDGASFKATIRPRLIPKGFKNVSNGVGKVWSPGQSSTNPVPNLPGSIKLLMAKADTGDSDKDQKKQITRLTPSQMKRIAEIIQKSHKKSSSITSLYDTESNTKIICRVVYPEDFEETKPITEEKKTKTPVKAKEYSDSNNSETEFESTPLTSARTRSGRLSRPPKQYIENAHIASPKTGENDSVSKPPSPIPPPPIKEIPTKDLSKFRCPTCSKVYIGGRMLKHFALKPDHFDEAFLKNFTEMLDQNSMKHKTSLLKSSMRKKGLHWKKRMKMKDDYPPISEVLEWYSEEEVIQALCEKALPSLSLFDVLLLKAKTSHTKRVEALYHHLSELLASVGQATHFLLSPSDPNKHNLIVDNDVVATVLNKTKGIYGCNEENLDKLTVNMKRKTEEDVTETKRAKVECEERGGGLDLELPESVDALVTAALSEELSLPARGIADDVLRGLLGPPAHEDLLAPFPPLNKHISPSTEDLIRSLDTLPDMPPSALTPADLDFTVLSQDFPTDTKSLLEPPRFDHELTT